jgi:hypothetical protein
MEQLGNTLRGTANFTTEADTVQNFFSEEMGSTPEESVTSEAGLKNLTFNVMEWDNASLVKIFGGATKEVVVKIDGKNYTVEKYVAPTETVEIEMSTRAITPYHVGIDIPRAKITARFIWNMSRTEIAQIEVTARALAPNGTADGPYEIYTIPATPDEPAPDES